MPILRQLNSFYGVEELRREGGVLFLGIPENKKTFKKSLDKTVKDIAKEEDVKKVRFEIIPAVELDKIDYLDVTTTFDRGELDLLAADETDLVIDLETEGVGEFGAADPLSNKIVGVGLCFRRTRKLFYFPICHEVAENVEWSLVHRFLSDWIKNGKNFVVHNLAFEKKVLDRYDLKTDNYIDTIIYDYLQADSLQHGLKNAAATRLGVQMTSYEDVAGKGKKQVPFSQVGLKEAAQYCGADVFYTAELLDLLQPITDKEVADLDHKCALVCSNMEAAGVRIDHDLFDQVRKTCELRMKRIEKVIYGHAGKEINLKSPKQLREAIYTPEFIRDADLMSLKKKELNKLKTPAGDWKTDSKALDKLLNIAPQNKILKYLSKYRNMVKIIGTYLKMSPESRSDTGNYHPYFKYYGPATGRLGSDIQQLPSSGIGAKAREGIIATHEDYCIWAADYSQIELRILAHLMDDKDLIEMFKAGHDPHSATAAILFNKDISEISKDGPERRIGKTFNFAVVYMQGIEATAEELKISRDEAAMYQEKYKSAFPNLYTCIDNILEEARRTETSTTLCGHIRRFKNINSRNEMLKKEDERQAWNHVIQGTAAHVAKQAMWDSHLLIKDKYNLATIRTQTHDEIMGDAPKSYVHESNFLQDLKKTMESVIIPKVTLSVPLVVDINYGANYWEAK